MQEFFIVFTTLIILILFTKTSFKKIENKFLLENNDTNFKLNFDNKKLKCKCKPENVENFTNYSREPIKEPTKPPVKDRIYSPKEINRLKLNLSSAEQYYEKYYSYPFLPQDILNENIDGFNNINYKDIGNNDDLILDNSYINNDVESFKYSIGK